MSQRVVLAYSGGLDTSVAIGWIAQETGQEVVAVAVDVGQVARTWMLFASELSHAVL